MSNRPSLIWVYDRSLKTALDSVTRLATSEELALLGWRIRLVASDFPDTTYYPHVEYVQIKSPSVYFLGLFLYQIEVLKWLLKNGSKDDIILFSPWLALLLCLLKLNWIGRKQHSRIVLDIRDVPSFKPGLRLTLHWLYSYLAIAMGHLFSDYETAITPLMAATLKIPEKKLLCTWPSGVTIQRFEKQGNKRMWNATHAPLELIYIGQIFFESSLRELMDGFLLAVDAGVNAHLKFIGAGPDMDQLRALVAQKGRGLITIEDSVPFEQMPIVLAQSHIGISPIPNRIKYRMSSPLKLFEYMASGMPVIATKIDCHIEVAKDKHFIFWVKEDTPIGFKNAILEAWNHRSNLKEMGATSNLAVQDWKWENAARKLSEGLLKVYQP